MKITKILFLFITIISFTSCKKKERPIVNYSNYPITATTSVNTITVAVNSPTVYLTPTTLITPLFNNVLNNANFSYSNIYQSTDRFNKESAYFFNGASKIVISDNSIPKSETWSISVWYKTNNTILQRLTTKSDNAPGYTNGTNYLAIMMLDGFIYGSAWNGVGENRISDTQVTNDGKWHHCVYIRDNIGKKYYLYVDGKLKSTTIDNFGNLTNSQPLYIGTAATTQQWIGSIDDIGVFGKVLSFAEVTSLFQN